jgi:DNA ligase (NAD+)
MGIDVGDVVQCTRANDVIPSIIGVATKQSSRAHFIFPTACPCCKTTLIRDGAYVVCPNRTGCRDQQQARVAGWIDDMGIKFLGDGILKVLWDSGQVRCIADLYRLSLPTLAATAMGNGVLGLSHATKILAQIANSRSPSLARFLGALAIDQLGERQATKILSTLGQTATWRTVLEWDFITLVGATGSGVGKVKARAILDGIALITDELTDLATVVGVQDFTPAAPVSANSYRICMTGAMSKPRKDLAALIVAAGHVVHEDVAKDTTHLAVADVSSTSSKTKKATKLGIHIIDEAGLMRLLGA